MTFRLDLRAITALCDDWVEPPDPVRSARAVRLFGAVAPWWLRRDVLAAATRHQPAYRCYEQRPGLPGALGSCWVAFAQLRPLPPLRDAFLLPVRWRPDTEHSDGLPPPLRRLADEVVQQLQREPAVAGRPWGLQLHDDAGLANLDLREFDGDERLAASGWAALAGGLLLAASERLPNARVWASAAWHPDFGIDGVEKLEGKLELAREWEVEEFFLPAENQRQALEWVRGRGLELRVVPLMPTADRPQPASLLREYLVRLGVPPPPDADWDKRVRHYTAIDRGTADEYHWTHLLKDIVTDCGAKFRQRYSECRPTHAVTVVSTSPSVVALAPAALAVGRCLLLYDEGDKKVCATVPKVEEFLRSNGIEPRSKPIRVGSREVELASIKPLVQAFCGGALAEEVVYDMTPGYKSLSLALDEIGAPRSWRIYCRHGQLLPDRRVNPGTEHYDAWQGRGEVGGERDRKPTCDFVSS
jgi:hypothetical protein